MLLFQYIDKNTSYRVVLFKANNIIAQNSINIIIDNSNDDGIIALGYSINGNTTNFETDANTQLTHSWNIQPVSVQNTVTEYIKSIGYNVSDFLVIEKLDLTIPVGSRHWKLPSLLKLYLENSMIQ